MDNELQQIFDSITDYSTSPGDIPIQNGISITDKIEELDNIAKNLSQYWNISLKKIFNELNETTLNISSNAGGTNSVYVVPETNQLGKKYTDARTDKSDSALANSDFLDYTIEQGEENNNFSRLLMPQYARRVEIEDLNKNFWAIGQNLTALNSSVSSLNNSFAKEIVNEVIDLWQNVYRGWQAISYLDNCIKTTNQRINSLELGELRNNDIKTRILITYGFGTNQATKQELEQELRETGVIQLSNKTARHLGIFPYIEKTKIYNNKIPVGYLYYVSYNRLLTNKIIDECSVDKEKSNNYLYGHGFTSPENILIQVDSTTPTKNIVDILYQIRSRNFVLAYFSNEEVPYLSYYSNQIVNPRSTFLKFYRDFLFYTEDSDIGTPLNEILTKVENGQPVASESWVQIGGLQFMNLSTSNSDNNAVITTDFNDLKASCGFLMGIMNNILEEEYPKTFLRAIINSNNINDLKNYLKNLQLGTDTYENIFTKLVDEFYQICIYYLQKANITDYPSYFQPVQTEGTYILEEDNSNEIVIKLKETLTSEDSTDTLSYYITEENYRNLIEKPIQWNLISAVFDESCFFDKESLTGQITLMENFPPEGFGFKNIASKADTDHLQIDFVENSFFKDSFHTNSQIETFTFNEFLSGVKKQVINEAENEEQPISYETYNPEWYKNLSYDLDINIPFTVPIGVKYKDFIRVGKPFPNMIEIFNILGERNSIDYYIQFNNLYLQTNEDLNNEIKDYGIVLNGNNLAMDGFWTQNNYPYGELPKQKTDPNTGETMTLLSQTHAPIFYLNAMPYGFVNDFTETTKIKNPNINIKFLNSGHNWQDIEVKATKSKTDVILLPTTINE